MKTETPNVCPNCEAVNSLFVCSRGAINYSVCCDYIRQIGKDEILVDIED